MKDGKKQLLLLECLNNMTKVYIYDKSNKTFNIDTLKENLHYSTIKERNKYKQYDDLINSLIGYTLLQKYLKEDFNIIDYNIKLNEHNKPYLDNIYFNISHSKNLICVVISNLECGIDIEYINYDKDYKDIYMKVLTKEEQDIYTTTANKPKYFTECFTKKEAYLKKLGLGIMLSKLKDIYISVDPIIIKDELNNEYSLSIDTCGEYIIKRDCTI